MVVGPPYPFVDGGGDLTCSQGGCWASVGAGWRSLPFADGVGAGCWCGLIVIRSLFVMAIRCSSSIIHCPTWLLFVAILCRWHDEVAPRRGYGGVTWGTLAVNPQ